MSIEQILLSEASRYQGMQNNAFINSYRVESPCLYRGRLPIMPKDSTTTTPFFSLIGSGRISERSDRTGEEGKKQQLTFGSYFSPNNITCIGNDDTLENEDQRKITYFTPPPPPIKPNSVNEQIASLDKCRKIENGLRMAHHLLSHDKENKLRLPLSIDSTHCWNNIRSVIQILPEDKDITSIFELDTETLGVFGTARLKQGSIHKKKINDNWMNSCYKDIKINSSSLISNAKHFNNTSGRATLHEARDLRCMKNKVVKIINKTKLPASAGGDKLWRRLCEKLLFITQRHNGLMSITDIFETPESFYIVTERLGGGELFEFLLNERAVPEELCKYLIKQILHALDFLHTNCLLHRDVKPENLMFRRPRPYNTDFYSTSSSLGSTASSLRSSEYHHDVDYGSEVKHGTSKLSSLQCSQRMPLEELRLQFELAIIDFDTCKMTDVPNTEYREICNGRRRLVGTYGYLAPEVLRGHEYTRLSDLWSVGVILYILMTGVPPVPMDLMTNAKISLEVLQQIKKDGIDFNLSPFPEFPWAQNLCKLLLEFEPMKRIPSARQALQHPWLYPAAVNAVPFYPTPLTTHHMIQSSGSWTARPFYETKCIPPLNENKTKDLSKSRIDQQHINYPVSPTLMVSLTKRPFTNEDAQSSIVADRFKQSHHLNEQNILKKHTIVSVSSQKQSQLKNDLLRHTMSPIDDRSKSSILEPISYCSSKLHSHPSSGMEI